MSADKRKTWFNEKLRLISVRNLPIPAHFEPKNVENSLDYMPKDNDIIICSYPKTGTTWMQYIVWKILHIDEALPNFRDMTMKDVPFMEIAGTEIVEALKPPRLYKHHFSYNCMNVNKNAKYIYIYRNPMDTVVSYYYFNKKIVEQIFSTYVDFDYFFDQFLEGNVGYGDFFEHVLQFYQHKNDSNLLLISYEDLHRDKKREILKVAKFLGETYYRSLAEDEASLNEILTVTEFNYMKQNINSNVVFEKDTQSFNIDTGMFRKGIVGDGKNLITSEQRRKLKEKVLQKIKNDELLAMWSI